MQDLRVEIIENGFIYPLKPSLEGSINFNAFGGVLNSDYEFCELSSQLRYDYSNPEIVNRWNVSPALSCEFEKSAEEGLGEICFSGLIHGHFGHMLLETLSRLWFVLDKPDLKLGFIGEVGENSLNIFYQFLELLDIDKERVEIIKEPKAYSKIYVPEAAFYLNGRATKEYLSVINKILSNVPDCKDYGGKLFLSSKYLNSGNFRRSGEAQIEKVFNDNGFVSFYPEKLPLKEQIRYIKSASYYVTTEGTSAHTALFLPDNAKLVILQRTDFKNYSQLQIDKLKNYNVTYLNSNLNFLNFKNVTSPHFIGITEEVEEFFKQNSFKFEKNHVKKDEIINYLVGSAKYKSNLDEEIEISKKLCALGLLETCEVGTAKFLKVLSVYFLYKKFKLFNRRYEKYFVEKQVIYSAKLGPVSFELNAF